MTSTLKNMRWKTSWLYEAGHTFYHVLRQEKHFLFIVPPKGDMSNMCRILLKFLDIHKTRNHFFNHYFVVK
jgi:hypothetical protein